MAGKSNRMQWLGRILLWTFFLSIFFNIVSQSLLDKLGISGSLLVLGIIIATGVAFDIIGIASTAATLPPLNARAAKRVPGAKQALHLARNSDRVASFCNDVVGDICGIISGSAAAAIVFRLTVVKSLSQGYYNIIMMAAVAALTVGGKGLGKSVAINYANEILMLVGRLIYFLQRLVPGARSAGPGNRK